MREAYKKEEVISDSIILVRPRFSPLAQKYESSFHYLEDLMHIIMMEKQPLALELAKEVMARKKEQERLQIVETITQCTTSVKTATHMVKFFYENYEDRDTVASVLVTTHEANLKEFQDKKIGNQVTCDKILVEVEKTSKAIEILSASIKNKVKELYPQ
ncbi:hypothetical protein KI387_018110, partial [Taxus chinensis]